VLENNESTPGPSQPGPASDPGAEAERAELIASALADLTTAHAQAQSPNAHVDAVVHAVEHETIRNDPLDRFDEALYHFEGTLLVTYQAQDQPGASVPLMPSEHQLAEISQQMSLPFDPSQQQGTTGTHSMTLAYGLTFGGADLRTGELFSTNAELDREADVRAGFFAPRTEPGLEDPSIVGPGVVFGLARAADKGLEKLGEKIAEKVAEKLIEAAGEKVAEHAEEALATTHAHDLDLEQSYVPGTLADMMQTLNDLGDSGFRDFVGALHDAVENMTTQADLDNAANMSLPTPPTVPSDADFFGPSSALEFDPSAVAATVDAVSGADHHSDGTDGTPGGSHDIGPGPGSGQGFDMAADAAHGQFDMAADAAAHPYNQVETDGTHADNTPADSDPGHADPGHADTGHADNGHAGTGSLDPGSGQGFDFAGDAAHGQFDMAADAAHGQDTAGAHAALTAASNMTDPFDPSQAGDMSAAHGPDHGPNQAPDQGPDHGADMSMMNPDPGHDASATPAFDPSGGAHDPAHDLSTAQDTGHDSGQDLGHDMTAAAAFDPSGDTYSDAPADTHSDAPVDPHSDSGANADPGHADASAPAVDYSTPGGDFGDGG
jgi:hypothetical protein